jgi:hypothetical protein
MSLSGSGNSVRLAFRRVMFRKVKLRNVSNLFDAFDYIFFKWSLLPFVHFPILKNRRQILFRRENVNRSGNDASRTFKFLLMEAQRKNLILARQTGYWLLAVDFWLFPAGRHSQ